MKDPLSIRRILLTISVLSASTFLIGVLYVNAEETNTVVSHGKSLQLKTTFEGTPTSFTRRCHDEFSVGYYVQDGAIFKKNSLLAEQDCPASKLDLDLTANGEGFSSVIARGKGTDLILTGSRKVKNLMRLRDRI